MFLIIFDLRAIEAGELTRTTEGGGPLGFPMSAVDDELIDCSAIEAKAPLKKLKGYVECAIGHRLSGTDFNPLPDIDTRQKAAAAIAENLAALRKNASTRAISHRGSNIVPVVLQFAQTRSITEIVTTKCAEPEKGADRVIKNTYEFVFGRKTQFTISEVARKSQIETDFNVLATLAFKLVKPAGPAAPTVPCTRYETGTTTTYESSPLKTIKWSSGHVISLAIKRGNVTLDATLPAVAPQLLAVSGPDETKTASDETTATTQVAEETRREALRTKAEEITKAADEYLRVKAQRDQEEKDLALFNKCPAVDPGRLESLQQVVCALGRNATSGDLTVAAVEALTKMSTPQRTTFLRFAVEHKAGETREKALIGLAQIAAPSPAQAAAGKEVKQTTKFLSGPLEHWSLSADVFTTRETGFKKDDQGIVVIDGKPPIFYISLNFLWGDLPSTERRWFENIELKWLLQGSDSPFDSIGFGIGYRGSYAKRFGFDFDLLSPFVGWTWTEAEDPAQGRVQQIRFGVSVNINRALDWMK